MRESKSTGKRLLLAAIGAVVVTACFYLIWFAFLSADRKLERMIIKINENDYTGALRIYAQANVGEDKAQMSDTQRQLKALSEYVMYLEAYQEALETDNYDVAMAAMEGKAQAVAEWDAWLCDGVKDNISILESSLTDDEGLFEDIDKWFSMVFEAGRLTDEAHSAFGEKRESIYLYQRNFTVAELDQLSDNYLTPALASLNELEAYEKEFAALHGSSPERRLYSFSSWDGEESPLLEEIGLSEVSDVMEYHLERGLRDAQTWIYDVEKDIKDAFSDYTKNNSYSMANSSSPSDLWWGYDKAIGKIRTLQELYETGEREFLREVCIRSRWMNKRNERKAYMDSELKPVERVVVLAKAVPESRGNIFSMMKQAGDEKILLGFLEDYLIPEYGIAAKPGFTIQNSAENRKADLREAYFYNTGLIDVFLEDFNADGRCEMLVLYGYSNLDYEGLAIGAFECVVSDEDTAKRAYTDQEALGGESVRVDTVEYDGHIINKFWVGFGFGYDYAISGIRDRVSIGSAQVGVNSCGQIVEVCDNERFGTDYKVYDWVDLEADDIKVPSALYRSKWFSEEDSMPSFVDYRCVDFLKEEKNVTVYIDDSPNAKSPLYSFPDGYEQAVEHFYRELAKYEMGKYAAGNTIRPLYELKVGYTDEDAAEFVYQSYHDEDYLEKYRSKMDIPEETQLIEWGEKITGTITRTVEFESGEDGIEPIELIVLAFDNIVDVEAYDEEMDSIYVEEGLATMKIGYYKEAGSEAYGSEIEKYVGKRVSCNLYAYASYLKYGTVAGIQNMEILE